MRPIVKRRELILNVTTGAERAVTRTGNHQSPAVRIALGLSDRIQQRRPDFPGQRVPTFRAINSKRPDLVLSINSVFDLGIH
jgi:hypothetical protein